MHLEVRFIMDVRAVSKPDFGEEQIQAETVTPNYRACEKTGDESERLSEQQFYAAAAERIRKGDADPARCGVSLKDALGDATYREYQRIDANAVSDEELFSHSETM